MFKNHYMDFRIAKRHREKQKALNKFCKKNNFQTLYDLDVSSYKKSDTVFILGSGASITELSPEQWATIAQHDSIGFNNWTLHSFIPTYFFFEPTSIKNDFQVEVSNTLYGNLAQRSEDYKKTALILHYLPKYHYDFTILSHFKKLDNLYFCSPINLPAENQPELELSIKRSYSKSYFDNISPGVYRRGSVAKIIHFAMAAAYKNIVLLGVDLNTAPYFFDVDGFSIHPGCKKMAYTSTLPSNEVHKTVDTTVHAVTMFDVIHSLNKIVAEPKGIHLYNGAASSSLVNCLPYYWPA